MGLDRKHRATGKKPPGGKRAGAGRKPGPNALGYGEVAAVKAAGLRVPESASEAERALADRCQERLIDVMEGKVFHKLAPSVLGAARHLREEICGPMKQRVEHSFDGLTDEQLEAKYRALMAKEAPTEGLAEGEDQE